MTSEVMVRVEGLRKSYGAVEAVRGVSLQVNRGQVVVLIGPHDVVSYARAHEAFVVGAAGIAALSLALSTGVVLSVRR